MKIELLITGTLKTWKHLLVDNVPEGVPYVVPVPCWLIEHNDHLFLFDAGQLPPLSPQPPDVPFLIQVKENQRASRLLAADGIAPSDLDGIILSHYHSDHTDGLADFAGVRCFLQKDELENRAGESLRSKFNNPMIPLDGMTDLCKDGRIVCYPTPGHTPGHQSLLLTLDSGNRLLLAADAAYTMDALRWTSATSRHPADYWISLKKLQNLQKHSIRIIPGHDPDTVEIFRQSITPVTSQTGRKNMQNPAPIDCDKTETPRLRGEKVWGVSVL